MGASLDIGSMYPYNIAEHAKQFYKKVSVGMKKRVISLIAVCTLAVGIAGCGSQDAEPSKATDPIASSSKESVSATEEQTASGSNYSDVISSLIPNYDVVIDESKYELAGPEDFRVDVCAGHASTFVEREHARELSKYIGTKEYIILPEVIGKEDIGQIGYECFAGTSVKGVIIPDSINVIDELAFADCKNLEEVKLGANVRYIASQVFKGCDALKKLILNDRIEELYGAFYGFSALEYIELPNSITAMNSYAMGNGGFTTIVIPGRVKELKTVVKGSETLKTAILKPGVKTIKDTPFFQCPNLEEIYIPESVTTIDSSNILSGCPNAVIRAKEGSYAAEYAKEHDLKFKPI